MRIGITAGTAGMGSTGSRGASGAGANASGAGPNASSANASSANASGPNASSAATRRRFAESTAELADYEKAGVELITVPELYGFDAVSRLGYVAARTSRAHLASGILQLYTRTPALLAMTAASLDDLSDGRFELGIGTSGPQVIEGFHGVPFDAPIGRTREAIEICRQVWRREPLTYTGRHYTVPLPPGEGTGLGKPLKLVDHPVRDSIPITIAAIGPQNVALAAERANGWQPPFYIPEKAADVWGGPLRDGGATPRSRARAARRAHRRRAGHRRRRSPPARPDPPGPRAVHRRDGRPRPQLLQRPGQPVRLSRGGQADPGPLPGRPEEGSRGGRPGGPPGQDVPDRIGGARARPAERRWPPPASPPSPSGRWPPTTPAACARWNACAPSPTSSEEREGPARRS